FHQERQRCRGGRDEERRIPFPFFGSKEMVGRGSVHGGGSVYHMMLDPRDGRTVYASAPMGSEPWGPAIYRGRAGEEPKATRAAPKIKQGSDLSVSRIWHIEPGTANASDKIHAGVDPAT